MPRLGSERGVVQNPLVKYSKESGWHYLSPEDAMDLRRGETNPVLWDVLKQKVQELNLNQVDSERANDIVKRIIRIPANIEGNLGAWEYLRGLRTVFSEAEGREYNLDLIDFGNPTNNIFHVTDEFSFTNGVNRIRADVVFLINGIPVIVVETKAATKFEGIDEALDQIRRYHREAPEFLAIAQYFSLTHLAHFYYGATWNLSAKNLFNWREEIAAADFESLVKGFVQPEKVLRVIKDYILFTRKDDELSKVILRPHQMRAVEKAATRAADPEKRKGLIWHTQGSGKTYTMITIAKRLIEDPLFENPTVLMLVDRNELEAQLFGNLAACGTSHVQIARSKAHLRELLGSDNRGLIVSMIHKFDDIPANINTRSNFFVLVDEAHRTTGGDLGNFLMGALPNATYLGFTGTPIDRTAHGNGTFKVFGTDDEKGYLDKYSIAESITDGTTVPLYYTLAPSELLVDKEALEKDFFNNAEAEGVSDIEDLNKILDRAVNLKNMLKNSEMIEGVAEHVANHYKATVEPMGYKAFLVGVDREACCLLKEALDKHLPPEYSQVVMSAGHGDSEELKRYHISGDEEKRIRKAFVSPDELPKILIVTEKLLTGYDAPVLYCMYLHKPMRDHVLLQAIARVNRPYEDADGIRKPGGFVLDYVGIFDKLEKALAFDSKDVESVIEDIDTLKEFFEQKILEGKKKYLSLIEGKARDKAVDALFEAFRDEEKRQEYYNFFNALEDLYEIISPDPFLRGFIDDYRALADINSTLHEAFEWRGVINRELAKKTELLVREHTTTGLIRDTLEVYEITPETIEIVSESGESDSVKVFNLLKSIGKKVTEEGASTPHLFPIGERAEKIAESFELRQVSTQEALKQLLELINETNEAEKERVELKLSGSAFAIYWLLSKHEGVAIEDADGIANEMMKVFEKYPFWTSSAEQARQARIALYGLLKAAGVKDVPETAKHVMAIVLRG